MRLTKRHTIALAFLATRDEWCNAYSIPDGNGHTSGGGASGVTLSELRKAGLIEYGKRPTQSYYGYRITDAGRAALEPSR